MNSGIHIILLRDPGDIRTHTAVGSHYLKNGDYKMRYIARTLHVRSLERSYRSRGSGRNQQAGKKRGYRLHGIRERGLFSKTYYPDDNARDNYRETYATYQEIAKFIEREFINIQIMGL